MKGSILEVVKVINIEGEKELEEKVKEYIEKGYFVIVELSHTCMDYPFWLTVYRKSGKRNIFRTLYEDE